MQRSISLEDLFGKSDSEADSDVTLDLTPQVAQGFKNSSSCVSNDIVTIDSDLEDSPSSKAEIRSNSEQDDTVYLKQTSSMERLTKQSRLTQGRQKSDNSVKLKNCKSIDENRQNSFSSASGNSASAEGKPMCRYGKQCYRKNPQHFTEYDHPDGSIFTENVSPPTKKQRLIDEPGGASSQARTSDVDISSSDAADQSQSFSFYLTTVCGIDRKFNSTLAVGIKDILSSGTGVLVKSAQFNYCIDIPWLVSQYPSHFRNKPLLIVHGAKGEEKTSLQEAALPFDSIRLCQAPLDIAYGTHHTKMMLLLYDTGLRVVIHTANLVESDWYQKTQGIWISPLFPKMASEDATAGDSSTHFKRDLLQYLSAYRQRSLDEWIAAVRQFDMSSTKVILIGSVPGRHCNETKNRFGHLKLRKVLSESGPDGKAVSGWPVIGQFSSVGSLGASSDVWLTAEWLESLSSVRGSTSEKAELRLVFPSKENVRCSLEGYPAGAALPYSIHTARRQPYFTSYLHQWKSSCRGRSHASPHIKTYTRASEDGTQIGWFLLTSANMSKAAWGSLEKNGVQLLIRSYELGVLFLPHHFGVQSFTVADPAAHEEERLKRRDCLGFPFPFDLPPTPYSKDDRPWIWDIAYTDRPDSNGNIWSPS